MKDGGILRGETWPRRVLGALLVSVLLLSALTVLRAPLAEAADGTILRTITADVPSCSVSTGIAFDGSRLLVSCNYNNQIYAVSPSNGARLTTYSISGVSAIGALAWDRGRGKLWACEGFGGDDHRLWMIDLSTSVATFQFTTQGCVDGLAYDGADDTIWSSADVASSVQHFRTDGTLISSLSVSGKLGSCGNSGIAVGGPNLFLANNGCSQIYKAPKTLQTTTLFGTYPARLEDLECDDITFAGSGKAAIWSKDAYDNVLNAFELNPGDCGYGGFASTITLSPATDQGPVGQYHLVDARVTDPTTGQPLSGALVSFSVVSGPNTGVTGQCSHSIFIFPPDFTCNTDNDGEVKWSYRGTGGVGHDVIEARVSVPSNTFPGTQEVSTTASMDWRDPARYVALGDSFSAGEGLPPYGFPPPGSNQVYNKCHRSATQAYSERFEPSFYNDSIFSYSDGNDVNTTFDFVACSSATTRNVRIGGKAQFNEGGTQLEQDAADANTNVATITIGGNDAGFSEVVKACALHACTSDGYKFKDGKPLTEWLPARIDGLDDELRSTFEQARDKLGADDTTIVVLGYPQLFPASDEEQTCLKLHPWLHEQDFLRQMTSRMNGVLADAAAEAGVHFVPVVDEFAEHEICGNDDEWINGTTQGSNAWSVGDSSFHPKSRGQLGYADALEEWLDDEIASGAPLLSTGLPANPEPTGAFQAQAFAAAAVSSDSLGTIGRIVIEPVEGSAGPCSGDLRLYSPGQQLHLTGSEFASGAEVAVTYAIGDAETRTELAQVTADEDGNIDTVVTLPADLPLDSNGDLQAIGADLDDGSRMLLEVFTLAAPMSNCDVTAPVINLVAPVDGSTYTVGEHVAAEYSCDDGPDGTGVVSCQGTVPSGSAIDTATPGEHSFSVTAVDGAGNRATTTVTYYVRYAFTGFLAPVDNPPVVNVVNAGRTVPVKWIVTDASGAGISSPSSVVSATSMQHQCDTGAPQDSVEVLTTNTGLQYLGDGKWIYNWQTASSYRGTCRTLQLRLADGSIHEALFRFR